MMFTIPKTKTTTNSSNTDINSVEFGNREHQNSLGFSNFEESINFTLSHFHSPIEEFPRKMMTFRSNGQFSVTTKADILRRCEQLDYTDYRINAYPEIIEQNGILVQPPNFIFIDLDIAAFDYNINRLDKVKNSTLRKLAIMSGYPTVFWTGNGYHIYLPLQISVLDSQQHQQIFSKDNYPNLFTNKGKYSHYYVSEVFLQFANYYFTNGKSDPQHRPKYKTCLIRIRETYNSKCVQKAKSKGESKVKVIQKWNGKRIDAGPIINDFKIWLTQQELHLKKNKDTKNQKPQVKITSQKTLNQSNKHVSQSSKINWIECLLKTPIEDHRKYCLWRILGPYLLNIQHLSEQISSDIIERWLTECSKKRILDFDIKIRVYGALKSNRGYSPISLSKLSFENNDLFLLLKSKRILT